MSSVASIKDTFEIVEIFRAPSDRVKCVDIHPVEPLVLLALYSGNLTIWNYQVMYNFHISHSHIFSVPTNIIVISVNHRLNK